MDGVPLSQLENKFTLNILNTESQVFMASINLWFMPHSYHIQTMNLLKCLYHIERRTSQKFKLKLYTPLRNETLTERRGRGLHAVFNNGMEEWLDVWNPVHTYIPEIGILCPPLKVTFCRIPNVFPYPNPFLAIREQILCLHLRMSSGALFQWVWFSLKKIIT